ncbi:hypothetical protein HZA76_00200 [Candidatus Roizmanbacteria bacterium]|nr:hypothetical protein [Candidatus Roizmanbacteria bacterium]
MTIVKKIIDYGVWVIFFVFFGYSSLFYVTKDSLPGDKLYGAKLAAEKILIASSSVLYKQVDFQINFVARRFDEVTKVLASKYGTESLERLDGQVVETAETITNIKDPVERKEAAAKYVAQLSSISSGLANEKQKIVSRPIGNQPQYVYNAPTTNTGTNSYSPPATQTPQNQPENTYPTPTPPLITQTQSASISNQIDETQATIQETINDMNQIQLQDSTIQPTVTPTPTTEIIVPPTSVPTQPPTPTTSQNNTPTPDLPGHSENAPGQNRD